MELYNYFKPNMVFQQKKDFVIKVKSEDKITDAFITNLNTNKVTEATYIVCNNDSYIISFKGIKGSLDEYSICINSEKEKLELSPVFFGDVFLTLGQSNMSYSLNCIENSAKFIKKCDLANIYALQIEESNITKEGYINRPYLPQDDIANKFIWKKITSDNAASFSALSVLFTLELSKKIKDYPIAFISTAMGGISIDAFLPNDEVNRNKKIKNYLISIDKYIENPKEQFNTFNGANYTQTAGIYNEKIYPLRDLCFKAAIWYQGENSCFNFKTGKAYIDELNCLIKSYRKLLNNSSLPFVITGIAEENYCYGDGFGYIYVQEALESIKLKNTYFVPIYDIEPRWIKEGEEIYFHPIHPTNKEEVGRRYFKIIYENVYLNNNYFYPYIDKVITNEKYIDLKIRYAKEGLKVNDTFFGFTIAGNDNIYYAAKATVIDKDTIRIESEYVNNPKYYTYGIMQYPFYCNCKTIDKMPLLQGRSKYEDMTKSTYLLNQFVLSCDYLSIRENNFGTEVGGGFIKPLFENGEIMSCKKTKISLDKINKTEGNASILFEASPTRDSYYYAGLKCNLSLAGFFNNMDKFKYLSIDLKGNKDIEFHGILIRLANRIVKLAIDNKNDLIPYILLTDNFKTYTISLTKYESGEEGIHDMKKDILKNAISIELYFRSKKQINVNIDNIRFTNINLGDEIERVHEQEKDASMMLPTN